MSLPAATLRFVERARDAGLAVAPIEFPDGTKTARDAATAIGCDVAEIVKSLVFVADDEAVLALVPGDRRLDTGRLAVTAAANRVRRAGLDEARDATGFAAGGTPPFGHPRQIRTFADRSLRRFERLWAAAGTPTTVFPISLDDLDRVAAPVWADLAEGD
jgi:prolyl-tRNA editing enzyme YbaK/EbsC (Cys-tRNA(Pro) deacylase)